MKLLSVASWEQSVGAESYERHYLMVMNDN